jgi:hypothetical protein
MRFVQAFAGAAFEKDVVGSNDRGATVLLQDGEDVLEEVELLVARARPDCPRGSACNKKGALTCRAAVAANRRGERRAIASLRRQLC